jgi:hypothetical protein
MFEEQRVVKVFRVTVKKIIERLLEIQDCPTEEFKELVIEKFDGYDYEGEEELIGLDTWSNNPLDGEYTLQVNINHEHAYEFTLYINVLNNKATVTNVL